MFKGYKDYIKYLKNNPEGYWFKRKAFGWGWTPVTWQGWLTTLVFIALAVALASRIDESASDMEVTKQFLLPLVILTLIFIAVAYRTGEKPKFTWGFPKNDDNDNSKGGNSDLNKNI